jgi:hypothetical protein
VRAHRHVQPKIAENVMIFQLFQEQPNLVFQTNAVGNSQSHSQDRESGERKFTRTRG